MNGDLLIVANNDLHGAADNTATELVDRFSDLSPEEQIATGFSEVVWVRSTPGNILEMVWHEPRQITVLFLPNSFAHQAEILARLVSSSRVRIVLVSRPPLKRIPGVVVIPAPEGALSFDLIRRH
ncbi:MAG: hypothetical protein AAB691_02110 [Patescibacteria group bacterium]